MRILRKKDHPGFHTAGVMRIHVMVPVSGTVRIAAAEEKRSFLCGCQKGPRNEENVLRIRAGAMFLPILEHILWVPRISIPSTLHYPQGTVNKEGNPALSFAKEIAMGIIPGTAHETHTHSDGHGGTIEEHFENGTMTDATRTDSDGNEHEQTVHHNPWGVSTSDKK